MVMVELEFRVIYVCHLDRDPTVILVLLGHRRQPRCLVRQQRSVLLRVLLLLSHARQSLRVSFVVTIIIIVVSIEAFVNLRSFPSFSLVSGTYFHTLLP